MKLLLRVILTALLGVLCLPTQAQDSMGGLMISPQTNEVIPPAPSSAQQIRYQSPQPSLATGVVNLTIPLYAIDVEGLTIPFTLVYHTSGIKPLEDPFPCGYGWSLQPALKVVRTIRSRPDEQYEYCENSLGILSEPINAYASMVADFAHAALYTQPTDKRYDVEKDIFTISLPGNTVARVITEKTANGYAFTGGGDDGEIIVSGTNLLGKIIVKDSKGIIYQFSREYSEELGREREYDYDTAKLITSWGIEQITLPSGRVISFHWVKYNHENKKIRGGASFCDRIDPNGCSATETLGQAMSTEMFNSCGNYNQRLHLSEVAFPGGNISIDYEDVTRTYENMSVAYQNMALVKFTVTSGLSNIKEIVFKYGLGYTESKFLKSINISGEGEYKFEYDPQRFEEPEDRHKIDWWGYFNNSSSMFTVTPNIGIKSFRNIYTTLDGAEIERVGRCDRTPDSEAMRAGILTKVTYPTGGSSEFEYEPHQFPPTRIETVSCVEPQFNDNLEESTNSYLTFGGGLRVKKIVTTASEESEPIVKTYSYDSVKIVSVPSAGTFVSVCNAMGAVIKGDKVLDFWPYIYRLVTVSHQSDYMNNHIGEDAIWYPKVTEYTNEGKTEYAFYRKIASSTEYREWGYCRPIEQNNVFSKGALLQSKITYKLENNRYKKVETQEFQHEIINNGWVNNSYITRYLVQAALGTTESPDFTNGHELSYPDGKQVIPYYLFPHALYQETSPYRVEGYTINLYSEQLRSKTVIHHFDNGEVWEREIYDYKPGTSIITAIETERSGDSASERVDITYPSPTGTSVERDMIKANMTGVAISTQHTYGTAKTIVRHEMKRYEANLFRPVKTYIRRGGPEWLAGQYDYDRAGNIREYKGEDDIPTTYLWGYGYQYPVYSIDGATYKEIEELSVESAILDGHAESKDILDLLRPWYVTKAMWRPLTGMTSLQQPSGVKLLYAYDKAGRLAMIGNAYYGPTETYGYHVNEGGYNFMTRSAFTSTTDTQPTVRGIINYDGLGREQSQLIATPTLKELNSRESRTIDPLPNPLIPLDPVDLLIRAGYYATYTEYDSMDRPYRAWSPVTVSQEHPVLNEIITQTKEFYNTEYAYTTTSYEASPLERVTGTQKAGSEWQSTNRKTTTKYFTNSTEGDYKCPKFTLTGTSLNKSVCLPGTLYVEDTCDEEGHRTLTFTDHRGLTIMTREGKTGDWNDTRYIYNDYGDLLAVLQPMADEKSASLQPQWSFSYVYDDRGRVIEKRMPGCAPVYYQYDAGGRLFAEQDGNMRDCGEWLFHFYDLFGREAFTAIGAATLGEVCMAGIRMYTAVLSTSASPRGPTGGYAVDDFQINLSELDVATHYDDYTSGILSQLNIPTSSQFIGEEQQLIEPKGLPTITITPTRISTVYYDKAERQIATCTIDAETLMPVSSTATEYDYEGHPLQVTNYSLTADHNERIVSTYSYFSSGQLKAIDIHQDDKYLRDGHNATIAFGYDNAGRISHKWLGEYACHNFSYNANGWLTESTVTYHSGSLLKSTSASSNDFEFSAQQVTLFDENVYYADAPNNVTSRFDGKIAARYREGDLTSYLYDIHGRLSESKSVTMEIITEEPGRDYSTKYTYDKNANITRFWRNGIIDIIDNTKIFGSVNNIIFSHNGNQLKKIFNVFNGEDYEGRTGVGISGSVEVEYDANGNLIKDLSRNIGRIKYNRQNLPTEVTFGNGQRQTISYDGLGNKIKVEYAQVPEAMITAGSTIYNDGAYKVYSTREYVGPFEFVDGKLEYTAFEGGYFDPTEGAHYYVTDWQGNNVKVLNSKGRVVQSTMYYPYGEPTIEPQGQRYLYGGKEREHAGGRNSYDFGARNLTPYGRWSTQDNYAESFYSFSPYTYCIGDPINNIDKDGNFALNGIAGIVGAVVGGLVGGSLQAIFQYSTSETIDDWNAIYGAILQGAITGGMAGLTMGGSLTISVAVGATSNVIGGIANREIQDLETTTSDVVIDATVGGGFSLIGKALGKTVKNWIDRQPAKWKGNLGENVTRLKYGIEGYKIKGIESVETGEIMENGKSRVANYDFLMTNRFTNNSIIVESKFNTSGLTRNQRLAFFKAKYPVRIDRTTSNQISRAFRASITGSSGVVSPYFY